MGRGCYQGEIGPDGILMVNQPPLDNAEETLPVRIRFVK